MLPCVLYIERFT